MLAVPCSRMLVFIMMLQHVALLFVGCELRWVRIPAPVNSGRLAMIAMSGMLIQNGLTGQSPMEQLTAGHISPFNDGQGFFAFDPSAELGACPPLGYWDPFGMMAFQDEEKFRRNRELELKHGRICMVATIGMIVPDLFGRFGGDLSPSMGLKFSDIPCTIEAIYKVPTFGWLQIFALAGAIEAKNQAFPENYGYPPFWGRINTLEPEEKQKKLLAEINNGRLAMVAMAAIVAQNGCHGPVSGRAVHHREPEPLRRWLRAARGQAGRQVGAAR